MRLEIEIARLDAVALEANAIAEREVQQKVAEVPKASAEVGA